MMTGMLTYRHPRLGFEIAVPEGWQQVADSLGTALILAEPAAVPPRFRANIVIAVEELPSAVTPGQWHARSVQMLGEHLNGFQLVDIATTDMDNRVERRTLGRHTTDAGLAVVEQWLRFDTTHCFTLTATTSNVEYAAYREIFRSIASSLRLPGS